MISLIRKLIPNAEQRLFFVGMIVIAANAGGAWSPIGDITTTMLWIGGQITAVNIIKMLLVPSLVCILVPLIIASRSIGGEIAPFPAIEEPKHSSNFQRNLIFSLGVGTLLLIPIFKTVTHLPPVMGMLLGLGVVWILTEMINHRSEEEPQKNHTVHSAIRRIDAPSILFFLGILLAVSALQVVGSLSDIADWLNNNVGSLTLIGITIGFLSAVVDNVPLVAAAQGMYSLTNYPPNHYFWELLAFCTGTGGSALIIGSAAGVAAMGLEKINFFWYLKNISLLAVIGYLSGVVVYLLQMNL